jgi:hypothetical protein
MGTLSAAQQALVYALGGFTVGNDLNKAQYNEMGEYIGGSHMMDLYCNSFLGASDPVCKIPSPAEIRAEIAKELASTSMTPANQQAALQAGDVAVAADQAANPDDAKAQCAASAYPQLSATLGPAAVAAMFGIQPDCTSGLFSGWLVWALFGGAALALFILPGGRH